MSSLWEIANVLPMALPPIVSDDTQPVITNDRMTERTSVPSCVSRVIITALVAPEMIPEMSQGQHSNIGTIFFAVGFSIMMVLDVALG